MSVAHILETAQYVVDQQGQQTGVLLDLESWDTLRKLIEELAEDERLGALLAAVKDDEKLEGADALSAYEAYLAEAQS
ncbi:MAG: hypothetical protein R2873_18010 [Caldilineaceae bacterium]|nr:hypothetical protein [Caldilineaceae bacterium]